MSKAVSQKRIATYRDLIGLGEGLSFSDYYDESVPYEVKPATSLCPMDEEITLSSRTDYWVDKDGHFYKADESGHSGWAMDYLVHRRISLIGIETGAAVVRKMFELGFIRAKNYGREMVIEYDAENPPPETVLRSIMDSAKKSGIKKITDVSTPERREIPINEIFINGMKSEQMEEFKSALVKLFSHLRKELKLKSLPKISLLSDQTNAKKLLSRTGYYDPNNKTIKLYITDRHPKDILRSFAHEVIHHWQHENKQLDKSEKKGESDPQYAQNDPWMRQMEKQAYLLGNIMFRDWEDAKKAEDRKSGKKLTEKTLSIGDQYPPRKPDYSG